MSRVPRQLKAGIVAVLALSGSGAGLYYLDQAATERARDAYVQAVASDTSTSPAVKVAMVMGSYYESSYKHIGTPYVDKLGKGQPLTVCNGLTGREVIAGKWYSPAECFSLEKRRYMEYEVAAKRLFTGWVGFTVFQQAVFLDFLHNKGQGNLQSSTLLRDANSGNVIKACRENVRWNRGTVDGVSTVLPGLKIRGDSNAELCERGLI